MTIAGALMLCVAAAALAQRRFDDRGGFGDYSRVPAIHNVPYDGQFTFVRVPYDTATGGWEPFERNMNRVFPGVKFFDMDETHPIFHAFFEINTLENFPQAYNAGPPVFKGVYQDNDPAKRLVMIVNYNTDISQFWEWSGCGPRPVDDTNEAYKLGVNYLFYGMTH